MLIIRTQPSPNTHRKTRQQIRFHLLLSYNLIHLINCLRAELANRLLTVLFNQKREKLPSRRRYSLISSADPRACQPIPTQHCMIDTGETMNVIFPISYLAIKRPLSLKIDFTHIFTCIHLIRTLMVSLIKESSIYLKLMAKTMEAGRLAH